jgi:hypothetical protein
MREESRLRVFVLRRIFGLKRQGNRDWRKLYNEKLNDLYLSPHIIWMIK